jgi:hypothetical protein
MDGFRQGCSNAESIAMPIKKVCRPAGLYLDAHQRAYVWAHKALRYRHAGKFAQAKAAARKALLWLRKVPALESLAAQKKPSSRHLARIKR